MDQVFLEIWKKKLNSQDIYMIQYFQNGKEKEINVQTLRSIISFVEKRINLLFCRMTLDLKTSVHLAPEALNNTL